MEKYNKERLIPVPVVPDPSGNLGFMQYPEQSPFEIKRVFYMFNLPAGSHRGGHAHFAEQQLIISLSGSFSVTVNDGSEKRSYTLNTRENALFVPPHLWRSLDDFTEDAVCLVLSSTTFDEADYIRDFARFIELKAQGVL